MAKSKSRKNVIQESPSTYVSKPPTARESKEETKPVIASDDSVEVHAEESIDEFMVRNGVFEKLLSQIDNSPQATDWEAELDELRDHSAHKHEEGDS